MMKWIWTLCPSLDRRLLQCREQRLRTRTSYVRANPSRKCSQERLTRGIVTSAMRRAAHPPGCARCGAGAGCSAIEYQSDTKSFFILKTSGNEVYYTNSLILLIKMMLYSKLHCQKLSKLKRFSYKIVRMFFFFELVGLAP